MKRLVVLLLIFASSNIHSQYAVQTKQELTGVLYIDSKISLADYDIPESPVFNPSSSKEKSPVVAGLLSLVLPGAGEFYTGEYVKAVIFFALEAGLVTTGLIYDKKGDDKTVEYQNYADDYKNPNHHWSVIKYAQWVIQTELGGQDPGIILSEDPTLPPWEQVNWQLLNANEHGSHRLPPHGDQQYYEMIGKYHQYSPGWNDFTGGTVSDLSSNFLFYSGLRGKANDYYNVASGAVLGIYINHFLSALDGVWSAVRYNSNLAVKMRVEGQQFADHYEYIPTLQFSYSF